MLRSGWLALGWLWVATVSYLSLMPHPPEPVSFDGVDKLEHALAYTLLMLWFCQIVVAKRARILLFIAFVVMGVAIEILQGLSGYRYFEYADMLANTTGVLIGFGLAYTQMGCVLMKLERNAKNT
jgi:VanZ family protein